MANEDSTSINNPRPKVFIDCNYCDFEFIKKNITFIDYVRDPMEAEVIILVSSRRTGGGGSEYSISFIGREKFAGLNDTLVYYSNINDSDDEKRRGLNKKFKLGLLPYIKKGPLADKIDISFSEIAAPKSVYDPWDSWVFKLSLRGFFNGERAYDSRNIWGNFSVNRITEDWKHLFSISTSYNESNFTISEKKIKNVTRSSNFNILIVKSISEHFSTGGSVNVGHSTYNNINISIKPSAAVEFNIYPYKESASRQLTFLYKAGYNHFDYIEETIYFKNRENLLNQSISAGYETIQTWGSINTSVTFSHYFHDYKKNKLDIWSNLSLYLLKGLSLDLFGNFSRIHDQLSLPRGGATEEEILLRRKALETTYSYYFSIGLSYTFGSVYSNVVNPRFDNY